MLVIVRPRNRLSVSRVAPHAMVVRRRPRQQEGQRVHVAASHLTPPRRARGHRRRPRAIAGPNPCIEAPPILSPCAHRRYMTRWWSDGDSNSRSLSRGIACSLGKRSGRRSIGVSRKTPSLFTGTSGSTSLAPRICRHQLLAIARIGPGEEVFSDGLVEFQQLGGGQS